MYAYSQDLRDKVIILYKTGKYKQLDISNLLSISYKTIKTWIKQYRETGNCNLIKPVKIGRKRKFDDKQQVLAHLQINPDASGKEMREALAPGISGTAFYNSLSRMGITYKKEVKYKKRYQVKRKEFLAQIKDIDINNLVYIDETGIDNNIAPLRGWAPSGVKSFTEALGFRTKRITLIAGYFYGSKELVAPMEYEGYTNTELFLTWVEKGLCKEIKPNQVVIMDNASFHKSAKVK
ncbi:MAG: transposase, ISFTu1 [Burkholderiales bacterium]|nr:transposase, ISFTu1 [Burkholderiales bacterium]